MATTISRSVRRVFQTSASQSCKKKPEGKPEGKAEGKPEGKSEAKPEAKAEGKTEGKVDCKTEGKPEAKPEPKPEGKPPPPPGGPSATSGVHEGGYRLWKALTFFVAFPCIAVVAANTYLAHISEDEHEKRPPFVPVEYLRIRSKRFPWGDGNKSLFHNPRVNALPQGYEDELDAPEPTTDENLGGKIH